MNVFVDRGPALRGEGPVLVIDGEAIEGLPEAAAEKVRQKIDELIVEVEWLTLALYVAEQELEEEKDGNTEVSDDRDRLEEEVESLKKRLKAAGLATSDEEE